MSLENCTVAVEKAKHPILIAIAVIAVVLVAAILYTVASSLDGAQDDRSAQAASLPVSPVAPITAAARR